MDASFIASPSRSGIQFIENYDRVSTLRQAEVYFSTPSLQPSSKMDAACAYVFEQHQTSGALNPDDRLSLWKVKLLMAKNYPELHKKIFPNAQDQAPPEDFEKKPELQPELKPFPKLPPFPKTVRIVHQIDREDGFVIVDHDPQKEAFESFEARLKARELKFQSEVMTLLLHDYGSALFQNPTAKFLWQTQLCIDEQPTIEAIMEIIGFPEPTDFKPEQKAFTLTFLSAFEKFFSHFSQVGEAEDPVEKIAALRSENHLKELYTLPMSEHEELIRTSEIVRTFLEAFLDARIIKPYRSLLCATLATKITEVILEALNPSTLFLFVNHLSELDFDAITHDPNPPLEAFKADDALFSKTAGQILHDIILHLLQIIPANPVEKKIIDQLEQWLTHNAHDLGETLQLAVNRLLKSPGRLKITQGLFHLLWSVKDGKTTPVFPNVQKGEELARAPSLLEGKFVEFIHTSLKWKIDHAVSQRNLGIRLLTKVGTKLSDKPIKSNLKKLGGLIFKLLKNRRLLLMMLGYIAEEFQLSKKE
jgi:hypothetical protein